MAARLLALLALLASAAALAVVVLALDARMPAIGGTTASLAAVALDPQRYAGRTVTISGRVAESDYFAPADARHAFVAADGSGRRLLVLPEAGAVPGDRLRPGTELRLTGRVEAVRPPGSERFAKRDLSPRALLARSGAGAVLAASGVEPVGARRARSEDISRTTVRRLVRSPRRFRGDVVAVSGRAYRISPYGFVLAGERRSIFVGARSAELRDVHNGERIRVRGRLERISRFRSAAIRRSLARTPEARRARPDGADLGRTPSKRGRPFIALRDLGGT